MIVFRTSKDEQCCNADDIVTDNIMTTGSTTSIQDVKGNETIVITRIGIKICKDIRGAKKVFLRPAPLLSLSSALLSPTRRIENKYNVVDEFCYEMPF